MTPSSSKADRFLARSMVARVATLSLRGQPHLTPLWFVTDGGRLYMTCRLASAAARDITGNASVAVLLHEERGHEGRRVLRVRGSARIIRRLPVRLVVRFALKYHLSLGGLENFLMNLRSLPQRVRYYGERAGEAGVIEIVPESFEFLTVPEASRRISGRAPAG